MSDARLRDAERRWRDTGAVEDEADYLRERLRAGDLAQTALELAAECGYEPAALALGRPLERPETIVTWARGVARHGTLVAVRIVVALAAAVEELADDHSRGCLHAAEAYALAPSLEASVECEEWWTHAGGFLDLASQLAVTAAVLTNDHDTPPSVGELEEACACAAALPDGAASVLRVVGAEVGPWVLGLRDPVRQRVARRGT